MWLFHRVTFQHFRCADCGQRSCCDYGARCPVDQPGPYSHRWIPMGTGKPILRHPL